MSTKLRSHRRRRKPSLCLRVFQAARRHPVRTLSRADEELVERTSFGIAQFLIIGAFTVIVAGWVVLHIARALLSP